MYINSIGHYIPETRITNDYFKELNGYDADWIVQRTGIHSRSRISEGEDATSMAINATKVALEDLQYNINDVDLIIAAGYTIYDTVGTIAHRIQREFQIDSAKVFSLTSACSSLANAIEIVDAFFKANMAKRALVLCSEANSVYNDYSDPVSGHLWGDGAVALFLSEEKEKEGEAQILDVLTKGLGHIGKGPDGVVLIPKQKGIMMNDGRDVFNYACRYMITTLSEVLERNNLNISNLNYIAAHQANLRIIANVAKELNLPEEKFFNNIQELGNTGSASAMLALAQNLEKIKKGDLVGITLFGGGYSSGAMVIQF